MLPLAQANRLLHCKIGQEIPLYTSFYRNINPNVLKLALKAYHCAQKKGYNNKGIFTIVDYTLPSSHKRLWVYNLKTKKMLFNTLVAHGKGTGNLMAEYFSDIPETHESSVGLYLTGNAFEGGDGYSMRVYGLDKGFNDKAASREIVMHGAWYVSETFVRRYGRAGRSWGCFAVPKKDITPMVNLIKNGTLLFAYYPVKKWLKDSVLLHCNGAGDRPPRGVHQPNR